MYSKRLSKIYLKLIILCFLLLNSLFIFYQCGNQAVGSNLPLKRVVLYRNGVGYFERSGTFDDDSIEFRVKQKHLSDFLGTLAIVDSKGRVSSASFESLEPEKADKAEEPEKADKGNDTINVKLSLNGDDHDLLVAYVIETPIWKPSYRIVMGEKGSLLQAWAVVQNLSGEDWENVKLTVTSGAPLSFRSDLGTPVIPTRYTITDQGEVVATPIYSETALKTSNQEVTEAEERQQNMPPASPAQTLSPQMPMGGMGGEYWNDESGTTRGLKANVRREEGSMATLEEQDQQTINLESTLNSLESLATGTVYEGVTRYEIQEPVTVFNNGSTMVAIMNKIVNAEDALLYRPDPNVHDTYIHPMRVVRMNNDSGVYLERGTVAVYQSGSLLGQGLLEPLPDGATTTIPFAIERAVAVNIESQSDQTKARLIKIVGGRITIEQYSQRYTTYKIQNGTDRNTKLYVRHEKMTNWELVDPPQGSEQVAGAILLPVNINSHQDSTLKVLERTPVQQQVDILSNIGYNAIILYLEGPAVDATTRPVLQQAIQYYQRLNQITEEIQTRETEKRELQNVSSEIRQNLEAIQGNKRATDLRDRMTQRMADLIRRIDELTSQIVELNNERSEIQIRLRESLRDFSLDLTKNR